MIDYLRAEAERRGLANRVRAEVMDGQQLSVDDASFDVSASIFGVLFFPDPDQGLRELSRVLIPGGRAVVSTWAPPPRGEMGRIMGDAMATAMPNLTPPTQSPAWAALGDAGVFRQRLLSNGFSLAPRRRAPARLGLRSPRVIHRACWRELLRQPSPCSRR
jgi:SAM-dependent methyltransferase